MLNTSQNKYTNEVLDSSVYLQYYLNYIEIIKMILRLKLHIF